MHRSIADKARFAVGLVGVAVVSAVVWLTMWAAIAPPAFGWSPVAVTSGSMEPRIDTGDIVIVEPFDGGVLAPGTVIVFDSSSSRGKITHRIVEVTASGDYVTRGDANGRIDSTPVSPDEIVGVGRMLVPGVGRPIVWVENGQWSMLVAAGLVLLLAAWASRWALLKRYDPWRGGVHVPPPPSGGRRSRFRLVPVVLIVLVALTAGAVTTQSRATFAAFSGNASSSVIADVLQPPTGVTATGGGDVTLSWTITPDTYASGHRVFRATSPGGPYTQIAQTTPRTTAPTTTSSVRTPPTGRARTATRTAPP
jgi:signal peptidase